MRSFSDGFYRYWTLVFVCSRYSLILDFSVRFCTVLPDLIHLSPFSDGTVWFWTPLFVFWRDRTFFGRYTEVHFRAVPSDFGHLCSFLERYGLTLDTRLVFVFRRNRLFWTLASVFDAYHLLLNNLFISNFFPSISLTTPSDFENIYADDRWWRSHRTTHEFFLNSYIPRRNCGDLTKPGDLGGSGGAEFGISCIECRLLLRRLDLGGKTGPRSRGSE